MSHRQTHVRTQCQQTRAVVCIEGKHVRSEPTPELETFVGLELNGEFGLCLFDEKVGEYVTEEGGGC
jgi:hypothetical protein